jgi:hypothetical protein
MANKILGNLIRYIVSEIQDADGLVYRTRLVKLLYLCDVEHYQSRGETLTGLEWVRYMFGPYAFELPAITRRMGLDLGEEELDFSTRRGVKYEVYDVPHPEGWLEPGQKGIIDRVIGRWGNEDLRLLLDYVYCDTQPMKNAQFGQTLDFRRISRAMRRSSSDSLDLSAGDKAAIRALLQKRQNISRQPARLNIKNLRAQEAEDESPLPPMSGTIRFDNPGVIRTFTERE